VSSDLFAALCLVLVLEGLLLFVAPGSWKRIAEQLQAMPEQNLRVCGAVMVVVGLVVLQWIR
jgi:uncharacterized protein YjeT (DUF2065 family)